MKVFLEVILLWDILPYEGRLSIVMICHTAVSISIRTGVGLIEGHTVSFLSCARVPRPRCLLYSYPSYRDPIATNSILQAHRARTRGTRPEDTLVWCIRSKGEVATFTSDLYHGEWRVQPDTTSCVGPAQHAGR